MKSKMILEIEDRPWQQLKAIAALEGKTLKQKVTELILAEVSSHKGVGRK